MNKQVAAPVDLPLRITYRGCMRAYVISALVAFSCAHPMLKSSPSVAPERSTPEKVAHPNPPPCRRGDGIDVCKSSCDSGSQQSCAELGVLYLQGGDNQNAERFLAQACDAQVALGCGGLGSLYGVRGQSNLAITYLEKGCDMGDGLACESMGGIIAQGPSKTPDFRPLFNDAAPYYRRACDLGATRGCGWIAAAISDGFIAGTYEEAFELGTKACQGTDTMPIACRRTVELFEQNTPESRRLAARIDVERLRFVLLTRGCLLGDTKCCGMISEPEVP